MKYPITPEYLTSAPDPIVDLFTDLETEILKDICRRFKVSGEATESALAQIKILRSQGVKMKKIEKVIKRTLDLSGKELQKIFERAVERNKEYYAHLLSKTELLSEVEAGISKQVQAIQRQTHDEFVNLTQSLGFAIRTGSNVEFLPVAKTYQKILDDASAQVMSGAFDYNTAIRNAVKRLADSGLQMIDYASGWHNRADVAARRAVMTGVSQLSSQYAESVAGVLETDYREITAHIGARDTGVGWQNHKSWQGKVYSLKAGDKYPSIYKVCGWGQVDGLEGANCRHHHFPFVDGVSERTYTDEQLANIDPPPFEYQGKTYTAYEAMQKQRQIETAMRKCKREIIGYEAAGQAEPAQDSSIRLRRLSNEYKAFSKAAGLRTQPERARVTEFGRGEAARATAAYKRVEKLADTMYDVGSAEKNVTAWLRDKPVRDKIIAGVDYPPTIERGQQRKHIPGSLEYNQYVARYAKQGQFGPSRLTITEADAQALVDKYRGTGILPRDKNGHWLETEIITMHSDKVGVAVNNRTGAEADTTVFKIHYGKKGTHVVPDYPSKKGAKNRK